VYQVFGTERPDYYVKTLTAFRSFVRTNARLDACRASPDRCGTIVRIECPRVEAGKWISCGRDQRDKLSERAIAGNVPRHRRHLRHPRQLRVCNLQKSKGHVGSNPTLSAIPSYSPVRIYIAQY
jgi:hypothetical protein